MGLTQEVECVAKQIGELYSALKGTDTSAKIAKKINTIMIHDEGISVQVLLSAWDYYAYKKGVTKTLELEVKA